MSVSTTSTPNQSHQELFLEYAKTRNIKTKNEIAIKNQKLVTFIVTRYYNKKEHKELREDLLQEGRIGLLSAIDKFKLELGWQFSTYATLWIKQSINNFLLTQLPLIKVPSNVRTMQNKVLRKLREENFALQDLIEGTTSTVEVTEKMLQSIDASLKSKWVTSLEEPVSSDAGNDTKLQDVIVNSEEISLESLTDYTTLKNCLKHSLKSLPERERLILLLRYNVIDTVKNKGN